MALANAASPNTSKNCNLPNSFIQCDLDSKFDNFEPRRMQIDPFTGESITENADDLDNYYTEEEAETEIILYDYDNPSLATLDAEATLYKWNMWMGIMHFSQALLILVLSLTVSNMKAFTLPLVTHYLSWVNKKPVQATQ